MSHLYRTTQDEVTVYRVGLACNCLAILISIPLLILITKKLSKTETKFPQTLKFWIYSLYVTNLLSTISQILLLIILPISSKNINQIKACKAVTLMAILFTSFFQISVFNFFMERLYIPFKNTPLK